MTAEEEMIKVEERERIRRAYFVEKKSIRQIARELRHSRDTVKKAVESAEPARYVLKRARLAPVLGPYMGRIDELLEENERLPRKQRYTGRKIYQDVRAKGYRGSESRVRGYIAQRRRAKKKRKVYIPLEFDPGADAQVDWGEALVMMDCERITVQLFLMRLCYSRRLFVGAFPTQKQEAFCEGHVRAFHTRRPQPPRRARRLHFPVPSSSALGFTLSGRLATLDLRNEAESGSLALRLIPLLTQGFAKSDHSNPRLSSYMSTGNSHDEHLSVH
jgi:hypothetical protein